MKSTRTAGRGIRVGLLLLLATPALSLAIEATVERWTVEPGTDLLLVEDHRAPLVRAVIEFPVGTWSPWTIENGAEEAFSIQFHDSESRLRARADRLSVDLELGMGPHHASLSFDCLTEDIGQALELVQELLANRDFDLPELKRWTKSEKLAWDTSLKDPEFRIGQASARLLFAADDPRRLEYEKPTPNETRLARLAAARDVVVRLPGRAIGFAGDLTREEATRWAEGLLPPVLEVPPEGLEPVLRPLVPREQLPDQHVETMPHIAQTFFAYGRASLTYADPEYPAFLVADHVLGGHFFSRLYTALRHEGGETYGSATEGGGGITADVYALTTFTRAGNAAATEEKLREVLRVLHADGITEEEREAAAGSMLGQRPFSRQAPSQILGRALWERRHGLAPGFHDALIDRAVATSVEEVNRFVRDFYEPSKFTMVKVEPR